jgi:hypothetical protein
MAQNQNPKKTLLCTYGNCREPQTETEYCDKHELIASTLPKENHNQFVRCVENIQDLSNQNIFEYALLLGGGGVFSGKNISYNDRSKKYTIYHSIDNSKECLTEKELKRSNIGKGMKLRSLIAIID